MRIIPLAPLPKPRMTRSDKWKQRKCVVAYRRWCDQLRKHIDTIPDELQVVFAIPMPASWSAKRRASMDGEPHQQRPDLDNLLKALMDATKKDDSHVHSIQAKKIWAIDARIELHQ